MKAHPFVPSFKNKTSDSLKYKFVPSQHEEAYCSCTLKVKMVKVQQLCTYIIIVYILKAPAFLLLKTIYTSQSYHPHIITSEISEAPSTIC